MIALSDDSVERIMSRGSFFPEYSFPPLAPGIPLMLKDALAALSAASGKERERQCLEGAVFERGPDSGE